MYPILVFFVALCAYSAMAFQVSSRMLPFKASSFIQRRSSSSLSMRDGSTSSNYFKVGEQVRVSTDVWHRPPHASKPSFSSKGREGSVVQVWEKCEVDPACCCAELAFDAPIEVRFEGDDYDETSSFWTAFFAVDEIESCERMSGRSNNSEEGSEE